MGYSVYSIVLISFVIILVVRYLPTYVEYFNYRYTKLIKSGIYTGNFYARLNLIPIALEYIKENFWLGVGFNQVYMSKMEHISGAWSGDIMWPFFILFTGIVGTIFIAFIIYYFIINSFRSYKHTRNHLFLVIFAWTLLTFAHSFSSAGFNDGTGIAILPFALYTIEKYNLWKKTKIIKLSNTNV